MRKVAITINPHGSPKLGELGICDPLSQKNWNELLLASSGYSIFHTANWARVLADATFCRPAYLGIQNANRFKVLLPLMGVKSWLTGHRGVSLPFTDYCYPINDGSLPATQIINSVQAVSKKHNWKSVEVRGGAFHNHSTTLISQFFRHVLSLEGSDKELFARLRSNYRRKIRKGKKKEHKLVVSQSTDAVQKYYHLHCITRKRQGLPYQPKRFFQKIDEHIISQKLGVVVLLSHQGRYVAGDVFFLFGDKAIYEFGGLDIQYQYLNPSYLVMWEAIRWLSHQGCRQLCFGRTDTENVGLNQFKSGWGTQKQILNYYSVGGDRSTLVANRSRFKKVGRFFFNRMPDSVLKIAGALLHRHFG